MPHRKEPSVCRMLDRFDLTAKLCERLLANRAQYVGVAPLFARVSGTEFSLEYPATNFQLPQNTMNDGTRQSKPLRHILSDKGTVRPGKPGDQIRQRIVDGFEKRHG